MAIFKYKARSSTGELVSGEFEGGSPQAIADQILRNGNIPIEISEKKQPKSLFKKTVNESEQRAKLKPDELILLARQLYTLTKAGVPIMQALDGLLRSTDNKHLRIVVTKLRESLDQGNDFTTALSRQPKIFSTIFINLIRVGETTGNMAEVFFELSGFLSKDLETTKKVKAALRYPVTVIVVILAALIGINLFIIPKFAAIYAQFKAELPLPTRIIMGFSDFLTNYGLILIGVIVVGLVMFNQYTKTKQGRYWWDKTKLRIPIFGKLIKMAAITRFARTMAITVKSGVPIVQGLQVVGPAVGNAFITEQITHIQAGVERGDTIANSADRLKLFPPIVSQMLAIGEQSGSLEEMTREIADYYERELDYTIQGLSASIEPILIFTIAGMVLIMALGIFLPMWNMLGAMRT